MKCPGLEGKAKLTLLSFFKLPQCSWGSEFMGAAIAAEMAALLQGGTLGRELRNV